MRWFLMDVTYNEKIRIFLKLIFMLGFLAAFKWLNAYSSEMINECDEGYIPKCIALKFEADSNKDSKNAKVFENKILTILDSACKRDYNSCLVLANLYDSKDLKQQELLLNLLDSINISKEHKNLAKDLVETQVSSDEKKAIAFKEKAVPLLESSCFNDSNISACLILSYYNENGIAMAKNTPKAARLLTMALEFATQNCMLGVNDSCFLLDKYPNYLKEIESKVFVLSQECDKGEALACFKVAYFYTQDFYTSSQNIDGLSREEKQKRYDIWDKIDFVKSGQYLQKGCLRAEKLCENSIYQLANAKACLKDSNMKACGKVKSNRAEFLSLACDSGDLNSCYALKDLAIFSQPKRKIKYLQKLCKGGIIESCNDLYESYASSDEQKANSYAQRSCSWAIKNKNLSSSQMCEIAADGYLQGSKPNIAKAKEGYQYACDNATRLDSNFVSKGGKACEKLANMIEKYDKDSNLANTYFQKSCDKENSLKACLALANSLANSPTNINRAISIYNKILGQVSLDSNDSNNANAAFKKEIYINLVNLYSNNDIYDGVLDYASILRQIDSACQSGVTSACGVVANFTGRKVSGAIINKDIVNACRGGDFSECFELANVLSLESRFFKNIKINNNDVNSLLGLKADSKDSKASFSSSSSNLNHQNAAKILYIYSCRNGLKNACVAVFNNNYLESKLSSETRSILQKNICLNLADFQGPSREKIENICKIYAKNAFENKEYENVVLALQGFKNSNDSDALDLLIAANFELKNYDFVLKTYKGIYKRNLPNDYFFLAKIYEVGGKSPVNGQSVGLVQNYANAYRIYTLTNSPRNLNAAGRMHELGLGFYKDSGVARDFYKKACPLKASLDSTRSRENSFGTSFNASPDFQSCLKLYEYEKSINNIESARKYLNLACKTTEDNQINSEKYNVCLSSL
ncbi:hypothetical protein DCO58_10900 [Helicobacter saguini]|uniref:beta-lactamase n=1 Tax=Helicobacter saguini TaxID=1548018 RepID=A0A347VPV5_9HELI|nr:hypothetical protein [Helicobacter saguini]MWV61194.1 hypothetical protein [Helicobacter saguini]MWV68139.1 hypothetical protein [Helicobacter saguini]MWV72299.1 hypothetical protein [Helicobacter saguini]TLD95338.1 hypothetical protein LS64_003075 [Helicobacter saguini]